MSNLTWDLDSGGGSEQKAEFTRFPVGATRIRVLDKAPHVRWVHWFQNATKDGQGRSVNCPGMKTCPIDDIIDKQKQNGIKPIYNRGRRYAINVFNYETNRVEIMEQGKTFMEDLKMVMQDLAEEGKQLSDVVLRVRRTGTGKDDTKYRIDVQGPAEEPIPEDGVIDLEDYFKPHTPEQITRLLNGEKWEDLLNDGSEEESNGGDEDFQIK